MQPPASSGSRMPLPGQSNPSVRAPPSSSTTAHAGLPSPFDYPPMHNMVHGFRSPQQPPFKEVASPAAALPSAYDMAAVFISASSSAAAAAAAASAASLRPFGPSAQKRPATISPLTLGSGGGGGGGSSPVITGGSECDATTASQSDDAEVDGGAGGGGGGNEADGVWSTEIEQYFQEALELYPPCGRRKIILAEEGKMYGRNELIARYIQQRTGKVRTRKQVSSHIQVLARRKSKELQAKIRDPEIKKETINQLAKLSSAQIVSRDVAKGLQSEGNVKFLPQQPLPSPTSSCSSTAAAAAATVAASNQLHHAFHGQQQHHHQHQRQQVPYRQAHATRKSSIGEGASQRKMMRLADPEVYNTTDSFLSLNNGQNPAVHAARSEDLKLCSSSISQRVVMSGPPPNAFPPDTHYSSLYVRSHNPNPHHNPHLAQHTTPLPPLLEMGGCSSDRCVSSAAPPPLQHPPPPPPPPPPDFSAMQLAAAAGLEHYFSSGRSSSIDTCLYPNAFQPPPPPLPPPPPPPPPSSQSVALTAAPLPLSDFDMQWWINRSIASDKLRLVELCAFVEYPCQISECAAEDLTLNPESAPMKQHNFAHITTTGLHSSDPILEEVDASQIWDKFPTDGLKQRIEEDSPNVFFLVKLWADINTELPEGANYAVSSIFEGTEDVPLLVSTRLCSYSSPFVEKLEYESPVLENGRYVYKQLRSPMCACMKKFIAKLLKLSSLAEMNQVLENFTILQIVTNKNTDEVLLGIAYVLEVSKSLRGAQHNIYRLAKPDISSTNQRPPSVNLNGQPLPATSTVD
ncbi:transcriptional enhancer factor TEF 5 [Echinococcus multilocularis]|uniref:Transcriptional enhancer factor TEF 5 n=1 Tax=Echinococcus multilocularis TaxID=6211 RepID=A0A068Y288_ECHMU|nr:transcriptional enhancer factor TEF 5 [Echinococcus multilocularis]